MDPITTIVTMMMQNPAVLQQGISEFNKPGQVQALSLDASVIDFAQQTLKCYHRTARFVDADVIGGPWPQHEKYGATSSIVMRIKFAGGFTATPYEMIVAAMAKEGAYRAAVLQDNAVVPPNKNCQLTGWVALNP